jgi:hypothetical protein
VEDYARGNWHNARAFRVNDPENQIYAVVVVPDYPRKRIAGMVVMARVVGDVVVIEHDITDKPLFEALMQAGVPRENIVLTYAGEAPPES